MAELPDWAKDTPKTSSQNVPDWAKDTSSTATSETDPIKLALQKSAFAPTLISGAAELGKGIGAATELFAPETGKKIYDVSQDVQKYVKEAAPVAGTIGQAGSYVLPYSAATKGIQAGRTALGLNQAGALGRIAQGAATGGGLGYVTTPTKDDRTTSALIGAGFGAVPEAIPAAAKKSKEFIQTFKMPEAIANAPGLQTVGKKIKDTLGDLVNKNYADRAKEASTKYNNAKNYAREKQATQPFATSTQGQALIQSLENQKYEVVNGQRFLKGEDQIKGIDRLINAIKGKTYGGEQVPIGKGKLSSRVTKQLPKETIEKDADAIIEELRYLRNAETAGKPAEAYAGLSKTYRDQLIGSLEKSLYNWNPVYGQADAAYKIASDRLRQFETETMSRALRGEKFDFKQLAAHDEEFGPLFFKDANTVRELKNVTGSPQDVQDLAKQYVATIFEGKSPAQIQTFVKDATNQGWLQESGIKDVVTRYAQQTKTAESKQKILKNLGIGAGSFALGAGATKYLTGGSQLFGGQ
jgi:hypothetical protein